MPDIRQKNDADGNSFFLRCGYRLDSAGERLPVGMDRVCGTVCAAAASAGENGKINGITKAQKFFCAFVMLIPLSHTPFPRCNKPPPYIPPFLLPLSEVLSISPAKSHMFRL